MNILTVTLNPALDRLIEVEEFHVGTIHRVFERKKSKVSPGGKGINVSLYLRQLGIPSTALAILGGLTGRMLQVRLKRECGDEISTSFLYVEDETRENFTIVDKVNNTITNVNLPGPVVDERHFKLFMKKYKALLSSADVCEIGGTVPLGVPLNIYRDMVLMAKDAGATVIVNAHGEPLTHAVEGKPDIVKPDIRGSKTVLNKDLKKLEDYVDIAKEIILKGSKMVVLSFEMKNDVVATADWIYLFKMKGKIESVNLMGTGDAYIGGLIYGIVNGKDYFESARYGMAAAVADELTEEKDIGGVEGMEKAMKLIEMERIS